MKTFIASHKIVVAIASASLLATGVILIVYSKKNAEKPETNE